MKTIKWLQEHIGAPVMIALAHGIAFVGGVGLYFGMIILFGLALAMIGG